uniref:Sel1 repeat family protein n=1 Tax=Desulfatirhabdium butyrativorans TaxID=340467 RepID=A0A7C4VYV0_9BACT
MHKLLGTIALSLCCASGAHVEDCKDGLAAYVVGNYSKAVAILQPLATQGDDCAQYQLGEMFKIGQGVKQDRTIALELFKKSAAQGNGKAKLQAAFMEKE